MPVSSVKVLEFQILRVWSEQAARTFCSCGWHLRSLTLMATGSLSLEVLSCGLLD